MFKKALWPILMILAAIVLLAAVMYGCMWSGWEEKILGPSEEGHHHH
jgi:hypothetical protein